MLSVVINKYLKLFQNKLYFLYHQGGHFDVKHFLVYYYYGGMIYAALKNFKRAAFFFEIVSSV